MKPGPELSIIELTEMNRGISAARAGQLYTFQETALWRRGHKLWTQENVANPVRKAFGLTTRSGNAATGS